MDEREVAEYFLNEVVLWSARVFVTGDQSKYAWKYISSVFEKVPAVLTRNIWDAELQTSSDTNEELILYYLLVRSWKPVLTLHVLRLPRSDRIHDVLYGRNTSEHIIFNWVFSETLLTPHWAAVLCLLLFKNFLTVITEFITEYGTEFLFFFTLRYLDWLTFNKFPNGLKISEVDWIMIFNVLHCQM